MGPSRSMGKYGQKPQAATSESANYVPQEGSGQTREIAHAGGFRDCWAAVLFFLILGGLGAALGATYTDSTFNWTTNDGSSNSDITMDAHVAESLVVALLVAVVYSILYCICLRTMTKCAIYTSLLLSVVVTAALAVYGWYAGQYIFAIIITLLAALQLCWIWCIRNRIELAAVMLETSTQIANIYWGTLVATVFTMAISCVAFALWFFSLYSVMNYMCNSGDGCYNSNSDTAMGGYYGVIVVYFFAMVWIITVKHAVIECTAAGSFGTWYFQVSDNPGPAVHPVASCGAFTRSCTTSFGSLCYGSLIISIIATMRFLAQSLEESDNGCVRFIGCCLDCFLACIEDVVRYINSYAYCIVAIYGSSYCEAVGTVMSVFAGNGFDMLINDDISETVLNMGSFGGGILSCLSSLGYLYAQTASQAEYITGGIAGFLIGCLIVGIMNASIIAGVKGFYICFAMDPVVLYNTKPAYYNKVLGAWSRRWGGPGITAQVADESTPIQNGLPCQAWMDKVDGLPPPDYSSSSGLYSGNSVKSNQV